MRHVQYVYTGGLKPAAARRHLADARVGVLALARDGESYAIPMGHVLEDDRLLFRFGNEPDSMKAAFAEATTTATFTAYHGGAHDGDDDHGESWSVVARGPIRRTDRHPDDATLNELFPPFRFFDEDVADVEYDIYELVIEELTGREAIPEE